MTKKKTTEPRETDMHATAEVQEARTVKAVRLELPKNAHHFMEKLVRKKGLTMASYARMKMLEILAGEGYEDKD